MEVVLAAEVDLAFFLLAQTHTQLHNSLNKVPKWIQVKNITADPNSTLTQTLNNHFSGIIVSAKVPEDFGEWWRRYFDNPDSLSFTHTIQTFFTPLNDVFAAESKNVHRTATIKMTIPKDHIFPTSHGLWGYKLLGCEEAGNDSDKVLSGIFTTIIIH